MKYLFLDVDGVLNHSDWYDETHSHPKPFPISCFDPKCVERVNDIIRETGAVIVVSSSWRVDDFLWLTFKDTGLPPIYGVTPSSVSRIRGNEIQSYLHKVGYNSEIDRYAILDDDVDMLDEQLPYFVRTCSERVMAPEAALENGGTGLTDVLAKKVIKILNAK